MIKDVVAGIVPVVMDNLPTHLRHIRSGSLRGLGVSSSRRWFAAPEMPTIAEQGYVDCSYCDRRFVLVGGAADHGDAAIA